MRIQYLIPGLAITAILNCSSAGDCSTFKNNNLGTLTDWEEIYRNEGRRPAAPTPQYLTAEDGLQLAYREWTPAGWVAGNEVLLFIPGSTAHSGLYTAIGAGLGNRNIKVRIIDVRGHGLSVCHSSTNCTNPASVSREINDNNIYYKGRIGDSLDKNQIIRDVNQHIADLKTKNSGSLINIAGHSSGGGVVSRFIEHGGFQQVAGVALVAPFNHASQLQNRPTPEPTDVCYAEYRKSAYAVVDFGALGDALRGNAHRYTLYFRKEAVFRDSLDITTNTFATMMGTQTEDASGFWNAFTRPFLFLAGEKDALFDVNKSRTQFLLAPGARMADFIIISNTSHIGLSWSDTVADQLNTWFMNN